MDSRRLYFPITIYKTYLFHPNLCHRDRFNLFFKRIFTDETGPNYILAVETTNNNKGMQNSGALNNIFAINTMPRQTFAPARVAIIDDDTRWQL